MSLTRAVQWSASKRALREQVDAAHIATLNMLRMWDEESARLASDPLAPRETPAQRQRMQARAADMAAQARAIVDAAAALSRTARTFVA